MKRFGSWCSSAAVFICFLALGSGDIFAQQSAVPAEVIRGAYQEILAGADKNKDGRLSMAECMSISKDKKKIEKDCKYWDANGDGFITEEEYVNQVRRIMR